jgi:hypothetical protein
MTRAIDLVREGKNKELWQMCCGFLSISIDEFMGIQERLLVQQLELLNRSAIGKKIMRGARPQTLEEFRQVAPLTTYKDYCPELLEKREDVLPARPAEWVRTSGRSGEYPCRWIPITRESTHEMSVLMYGIAMLSGCKGWGKLDNIPLKPNLLYTVAPRPYMSGAMAKIMEYQTPINYLPSLELAENLSFEERIKLGFNQALSQGIDYFFGMSMVLVQVGEKFSESASRINMSKLVSQPEALLRVLGGLIKSKLARRPMLPKDVWKVQGILCSGLDSRVFRTKIKTLWGRYPLDVYASTEAGIIATQTWDYEDMTFVPNLNFLEFIPEDEIVKWEMDRSYKPRTLLMGEVQAGENYEIVITNFHGGPLLRYRIGDLVKITSLHNEKLDINIPQMVFERRADGIINFVIIQPTEKLIWEAIEHTGIAYQDWTSYKKAGESVLNILIEPKNEFHGDTLALAEEIRNYILSIDNNERRKTGTLEDLTEMFDFHVEVEILPLGSFDNYLSKKQAEGADLAHLKPPHLNPSEKILSVLRGGTEELIVVSKMKNNTEHQPQRMSDRSEKSATQT